jgi:transcriptional regulator with XRE-family HTH domain
MRPGELIRRRRLEHGLTQKQLAIRAGSTQAAISRLERDEVSPTFETVERVLQAMGEEPELAARRSRGEHDPRRVAAMRARSPAERLALGLSWNALAGEFARQGARVPLANAPIPDDRMDP